MRLLLAALVLVSAGTVVGQQGARNVDRVSACSPSLDTLEDFVPGADFIGVVEVIRVGDERNNAPTLTPSPTNTIEGAELTWAPSPTADSYLDFGPLTPTATATPTPVTPSYDRADLRGRGADVMVVEELVGGGVGEFGIDWEARAALEHRIRLAESGAGPICGIGGLSEYRVGQRYFVVASRRGTLDLSTVSSYRIEDRHAIFYSKESEGTFASSVFRASTYQRYLSDFDADFYDYGEDRQIAYVDIERLSVDRMRTLFLAMYHRNVIDDDRIHPPDTGNAGLKPSR